MKTAKSKLCSKVKSTPAKCTICSKILQNVKYLPRHMQIHEESKENTRCLHCDAVFEDVFSLKFHQKKEHNGAFNHECNVCGKRFRIAFALKEHMYLHSALYKCTICGKVLVQASNSRNMLCHEKTKTEQKISCLNCEEKFEDRFSLQIHYVKEHKKLENHECEVCGQRFRKPFMLRDHMNIHTDELECTICRKKCLSKMKLKHPIDSVHNAKFKCSICLKVLLSGRSENEHKEKHEKTKGETLLNCSHCDAKFEDGFSLSLHFKENHRNELSYQCEICEKKFRIACYLKIHMETHKDKTYTTCELCGIKLIDKRSIPKHRKSHENGKVDGGIKCVYCDEIAQDSICLRAHITKEHSKYTWKNMKRRNCVMYKCPKCDTNARSYPHLLNHFRRHLDFNMKDSTVSMSTPNISQNGFPIKQKATTCHEITTLPLTEAVHRRADIDTNSALVIHLKRLEADSVGLIQLYPSRCFLCVRKDTSTKIKRILDGIFDQMCTVVTIKQENANTLTFTVYSMVNVSLSEFESYEDFAKHLTEMSSCSHSVHFVRHSEKEMMLQPDQINAEVVICNQVNNDF